MKEEFKLGNTKLRRSLTDLYIEINPQKQNLPIGLPKPRCLSLFSFRHNL